MQPGCVHSLRSHTCGLRCVFFEVRALGKNNSEFFRRLRAAELCEAASDKKTFLLRPESPPAAGILFRVDVVDADVLVAVVHAEAAALVEMARVDVRCADRDGRRCGQIKTPAAPQARAEA